MNYGQSYLNYSNGQNKGYGVYPSQQNYYAQQAPIPQPPPMKTNKILVTSLTDAMSRSEPNTEMLYLDQDNPFIYQVTVDIQGRKTYRTFEIKEVTEQVNYAQKDKATQDIDLSVYATKDDLKNLEDKLMALANSYVPSITKSKSKNEKVGGDE